MSKRHPSPDKKKKCIKDLFIKPHKISQLIMYISRSLYIILNKLIINSRLYSDLRDIILHVYVMGIYINK